MIPAFPHEAADRPSTAGDDPGALAEARAWAERAGIALAPVAERPHGADDVDVLAIDATGAVVLVVGVVDLTADALVDALARAAAAREVAPAELAADHPGGTEAVRDAWWRVRAGQSVAPTAAPSLLVIAMSVSPAVEAALPLLAGRVHVHRVEPEKAPKAKPRSKTKSPSAAEKPAPATSAPETSASDGSATVDPAEQENLRAVVALVGEAALVLASEEGVSGRLEKDGTILVDGETYRDPAAAASAATGSPVADGWTAWRFGADGPFLSEALQEARTQPREKRPARPHRRRAVRG
ncbi:hypothetical protein [Serinibacter arcticus]|uniref:RAMA domain-containing protein n=1 Tax=Serinibacter arcticus TaxID=1655435 RepID=A0A4Z1E3L4_9MICO|nr:hypothetical protein [Serinibacter arcticus]TGO06516.1 hypothetical protein SERN_0708 [Serinibacter arcticus]